MGSVELMETVPVTDADAKLNRQPLIFRKVRSFGVIGSAVLCGAVSICILIQPDWLAPVILVPTWCWLLPGLILAFVGFSRQQKKRFVALLILWAVFLCRFVEETHSAIRMPLTSMQNWRDAGGGGIRIVSLNCNAGEGRSVEETAEWAPDILLLQESPGSEQLTSLTETLFGDEGTFLHGGDVSIMARGELTARFVSRKSHFIHARAELLSGIMVDVMSVRLSPPVSRLDFWTAGFWRDHYDKRVEHREQVLEITQQIQSIPGANHVIVGGDFNAPPHDDALTALHARLTDTVRDAGHGWGATGTNDFPVFRVDQIWAGPTLRGGAVIAQKTKFSDHRMIVCDLILAD